MFALKFIKFCIIGFSGMLVDFGLTWLLKEKWHINKYIANSSGFIAAASSNYLLNRIWTFESHSPQIIAEYLSFLAISIVGLALNNLIIWILSDKLKGNFYVSKIIATGIVTLWNFGMNARFTFKLKN
jgi:putative flippase GtrA